MKTYARIGMFETNSSTHNQIAIYMAKDMVRHKDIDPIIITNSFDINSRETYFDTPSKINIIYALIKNVVFYHEEYQSFLERYPDSDYFKEELEYLNGITKELDKFEKLFLSTLDKHAVKYTIDKNADWLTYEMYGMTGFGEVYRIFKNEKILEAFLFDDRSGFTFGEENNWPSGHVGYTEIELGKHYNWHLI